MLVHDFVIVIFKCRLARECPISRSGRHFIIYRAMQIPFIINHCHIGKGGVARVCKSTSIKIGTAITIGVALISAIAIPGSVGNQQCEVLLTIRSRDRQEWTRGRTWRRRAGAIEDVVGYTFEVTTGISQGTSKRCTTR